MLSGTGAMIAMPRKRGGHRDDKGNRKQQRQTRTRRAQRGVKKKNKKEKKKKKRKEKIKAQSRVQGGRKPKKNAVSVACCITRVVEVGMGHGLPSGVTHSKQGMQANKKKGRRGRNEKDNRESALGHGTPCHAGCGLVL